MRRLVRSTRPLSVLFALWFAAVLGDPGALHSCPMHGGAHGAAASHAVHGAPAVHHASHAQHGLPNGQPGHSPQPCTCIGNCCAPSIAAPLSIEATLWVPLDVLVERDPLQSAPIVAPEAPSLRLPFANGPPAV